MYLVKVYDQTLQFDQKKPQTNKQTHEFFIVALNLHLFSDYYLIFSGGFFSYAKWHLAMAKHYIVLS